MKLLTVDTSGPVCGVAVTDADRVLCEFLTQNKNTHSVNLMPMVEEAFLRSGRTLAEMDAVAAVTGPGSFTGVRIGVAMVKGLCHAAGKPCIAVNALEALARGAGSFNGWICPIQDARAGQVYGAAFCDGKRVADDAPAALTDFCEMLKERGEGRRFLVTGDGVDPHMDKIREILGDAAAFAPGYLRVLRPSAAAALAEESGVLLDYAELKEYYLRPPNAEKNKKLLEAMKNG